MTEFKFNGNTPLYYSELGLNVEPGDVHEFDEAPDLNWSVNNQSNAVEAFAANHDGE